MNRARRHALACCALLAGCLAETKEEAREGRAGTDAPRVSIEKGEMRVPFGGGWLPLQCLTFEDGRAELEVPAPGPGGVVSFIPVALSERDDSARFVLSISTADGRITETEGAFRTLDEASADANVLLPLVCEPFRVPLDHDAGTTLTLRWSAFSGRSDQLHVLLPKVVKPAPTTRPPDILMICADALRYDHSLAGLGAELMPNLQEIGRESVVYKNAYSPGSWTLPSMSSVLTGLWPLEHGAGKRPQTGAQDNSFAGRLPPGLPTMAAALRERGYTTVFIYSNAVIGVSGMYREGFDLPVESTYQRAETMHESLAAILKALPPEVPLFVMLHYLDVHHYKQWYFNRRTFREPLSANPKGGVEAYESGVRLFDGALAQLRATWSARRDFESTFFVMFADHGEHLVDPGYESLLLREGLNPLTMRDLPLFNHGSSADEVLLHVPLIVRRPKSERWRAGVVDAPVSLIDLFPTVLAEAGMAGEEPHVSGIPLPVAGEAAADDRVFFTDYQLNGDELSSVRQGPFKLVINHTQGSRKLIDLQEPLDEAGEAGQAVLDEAVEKQLFDAWTEYEARAKVLRESRPQPVIEQGEDVAREMRKMGYL